MSRKANELGDGDIGTFHDNIVNSLLCQRMLAQLASSSGGTPQILSSNPHGGEFYVEGKKISSLA
jgi:hypothetical protein